MLRMLQTLQLVLRRRYCRLSGLVLSKPRKKLEERMYHDDWLGDVC